MSPIKSSDSDRTRRWAVIQLNAGETPDDNLERAVELIREAAGSVSLVALPEFFLVRGDHETILRNAIGDGSGVIEQLSRVAKDEDVNILGGSVPYSNDENPERCFNRSMLFDSDGNLVDHYDKIHRFDLDLDDGITVKESGYLKAGDAPVTVDVDGFRAGLSVCYDLRFPKLYQAYADQEVDVLFVPSNFTRETGRAHWMPLLRARAIENQAYVVAPNQYGKNPETGVPSLGQSCVIDPWGTVLTCCPDRESWATAELDGSYLKETRRQLPSLTHRQQTPETL